MNKNKKNKKAKTNAEKKQVVSTSSVISEKLQGDIDELKNSYDSFLYVSKPFSSTNINNLQAKAKMYGLNPVPLKGARVLELGASCGGNIVPQALYYPETTFTGIDLSGVQVKHGNDIINSIGLKNVTLLEKDILDIDESFGTFDYIIVHGIWSWVPDVVKDKILSICNVNLSDNGIAYVSYNTYPGWKRLEQLRDIMLYSEKRAKDQDLLERTLYTKSVLKMVADTMNIDDRSRAQSAYKINNIHNVLNSNDYYVAHEYLEAFNDPVYVSDFIERARKHGCAYIGDEVLQRSFITWLADDVTNNIRTLSHDNYVDKEQFYDYVYDTQFRMSLLTKLSNEDKINHEETVTQDILNSLYYVGNSRNEKGVPEDWTDTVNIAIKELMDTHKQFNVQGIINHINSQYPGYNINMDQLYQRLLLLTIVGQINIFGESYPMTPFVENESYIPQRFINYVNTLIMKDGNKYMALGNMYNQLDNEVDNGVLYVMNQLAQPTSRAKLLELVESDLTVNRTTKDGYTYKVPSEQYLNEVLVHLEYLGYFTK
ncbi:class I SAM-dependent methyltransferase [Veillonella sp.]|uniref:class I SAM-dependent methyltransferase n=1 Tax=Veillonella sp. TaxID=1926307 RepID=UPI0029068BDF|nr:class I SAM-dependent methyltransferase [Veillonella sp.]MDU4104046.1 class I SAM-dependent methyltransferase [Veillonella sp.]